MQNLSELNRLHALDGMARTYIANVIAMGRAANSSVPSQKFLEEMIGPRQAAEYYQKSAQGAMVAGGAPDVNPFGNAFLGLVNAISAFGGPLWTPAPAFTRVGIDAGTGHEAATIIEGDPIPS